MKSPFLDHPIIKRKLAKSSFCLAELYATYNEIELRLKAGETIIGTFEHMPPFTPPHTEPHTVPRPVAPPIPGWMRTRPKTIRALMVFLIDNAGNHFQGTFVHINTMNGAHDIITTKATPDEADLTFKNEIWTAKGFYRSRRPNTYSLWGRNVPAPTINDIYIMMLSGNIYKTKMTRKDTVHTNSLIVGKTQVGGTVSHTIVTPGYSGSAHV